MTTLKRGAHSATLPSSRKANDGRVAGAHNRRARRAAKAKQRGLFTDTESEEQKLRAMWEAFGRHQRNRIRPEFDPAAYEMEHGYGDPWPDHIPHAYVVHRVLRLGPVFARMPRETFDRYREAVVDSIAFAGSEHLGCDTGALNKREMAEKRAHVRQFARALAMLSCAPDGVKFCSNWFETRDGKTEWRVFAHVG